MHDSNSTQSFLQKASLKQEKWKPISGFPDYYVSSLGRIVSFRKKCPRLLKICNQTYRGREYSYVCLFNKGPHKCIVHRLVAIAFVENPDHLNEIDHINNIGTDNRACNLRWCTHKENMQNPLTIKREREYRLAHPFELVHGYPRNVNVARFFNHHEDKMKGIVQIKEGAVVAYYKSLGEAERNGHKKTSISAVLHNRLKTYHGCVWMLQEDYMSSNSSSTCSALS